MNEIRTTSIAQLVCNKETPDREIRVEHYLIPSYQRGYRWTKLHVSALLEDIDSFIKEQSQLGVTQKLYCLQPIVVVEQKDDKGERIWEIVDGQQRLTTLYIILHRLGRNKYKILFDKRGKSTDFLENLSPLTFNDDTPDFHFMSDAYRCIDKWFSDKAKEDVGYADIFAYTLLNKVQVIWYNVALKSITEEEQESEKIDIFNRLNIGKIPLEDAELVRALLMSKTNEKTEHEKLMRQAEFSNEWYEIEHWLQQDEVWRFLTNKTYANHIQLVFELMAKNKNSVNYNTYKWFEQGIRNSDNEVEKAIELWNIVKLIFSKFRYWYNDRMLYHYIGFLLSANLITLDKLIEESGQDKFTFGKWVYSKVYDFLKDVDLDQLSYESDQNLLKNTLLLFNVLSVLQLTAISQNRFPFNLYNDIKKGEKWSLEHIHAQKSQDPLKRKDVIKEWITDTLEAIKDINSIIKDEETEDGVVSLAPLKEELASMSGQENIDEEKFNLLRAKIVDAFESRSTKHLLDNMALLSCPDNAMLNNAIFPVKRNRIIAMEREGRFIPPCTRNVFLKLYSKSDSQPFFWSHADKVDYMEEIKRVFNNFKKEK